MGMGRGAILLAQSGSLVLWERVVHGRAWRTGSVQGQGQRLAWRLRGRLLGSLSALTAMGLEQI